LEKSGNGDGNKTSKPFEVEIDIESDLMNDEVSRVFFGSGLINKGGYCRDCGGIVEA
ncbi:2310_t:CDS:2, partial [Entrophospora sp. SA101]